MFSYLSITSLLWTVCPCYRYIYIYIYIISFQFPIAPPPRASHLHKKLPRRVCEDGKKAEKTVNIYILRRLVVLALSMVLVLVGNSEIDAHVWTKLGFWSGLFRHLFWPTKVSLIFLYQFSYTWAQPVLSYHLI